MLRSATMSTRSATAFRVATFGLGTDHEAAVLLFGFLAYGAYRWHSP
jgi:hypothetical protein